MRHHTRHAGFALGFLLLLIGAAHADPLKIRIGYQASPDKFAAFLPTAAAASSISP